MENPYEGPSLGGKEENTENRVKTYHTVNKLITISCWTMFGIGYECLYSFNSTHGMSLSSCWISVREKNNSRSLG